MDIDTTTVQDQRREKRVRRMQVLFSWSFGQDSFDPSFKSYVETFTQHQGDVDALIVDAAPEWPIEQMNKAELAILRSIILESLLKKTPKKVLINEAIEIGREFGTESSPKFINGVLGKILIDSE